MDVADNNYTPTTETVRQRYWLAAMPDNYNPAIHGTGEESKAAFDRWLKGIERKAHTAGYLEACEDLR